MIKLKCPKCRSYKIMLKGLFNTFAECKECGWIGGGDNLIKG